MNHPSCGIKDYEEYISTRKLSPKKASLRELYDTFKMLYERGETGVTKGELLKNDLMHSIDTLETKLFVNNKHQYIMLDSTPKLTFQCVRVYTLTPTGKDMFKEILDSADINNYKTFGEMKGDFKTRIYLEDPQTRKIIQLRNKLTGIEQARRDGNQV